MASRVGMRWSLPFDGRCGSVSLMSLTTRFAPSPTGYLHLGHAFSACNAWKRARDAGGRFLLRLEDIDPTRCHQAFSEAIQEDLAWLGSTGMGPCGCSPGIWLTIRRCCIGWRNR